jgi:hypothetical protein
MQKEQLGWTGNINWLYSQAEGDFFFYNQQDDHTAPTFLETLVATADREPQAASVYCDMQHFGGRTELLSQPSIRGTAFERVIAHIEQLNHACFHGLIRTQAVHAIGPMKTTEFDNYAVDVVWVAKLARWGELIRVPEALYFKEIDPETVHNKWFRWERERRREPWIRLFLDLLDLGQSVAETEAQRARLVASITARLAPPPDGWAFYTTLSREERMQLVTEFWERAERAGLCELHRDGQHRVTNVVFGQKRAGALSPAAIGDVGWH